MVPVDRSSDSEMGTAETMKGTMRTLYWYTGYGCGKALRGHLYGLRSYLGKLRLGGVTSLSWDILGWAWYLDPHAGPTLEVILPGA